MIVKNVQLPTCSHITDRESFACSFEMPTYKSIQSAQRNREKQRKTIEHRQREREKEREKKKREREREIKAK